MDADGPDATDGDPFAVDTQDHPVLRGEAVRRRVDKPLSDVKREPSNLGAWNLGATLGDHLAGRPYLRAPPEV